MGRLVDDSLKTFPPHVCDCFIIIDFQHLLDQCFIILISVDFNSQTFTVSRIQGNYVIDIFSPNTKSVHQYLGLCKWLLLSEIRNFVWLILIRTQMGDHDGHRTHREINKDSKEEDNGKLFLSFFLENFVMSCSLA